ncbi:hypothetical protein AAFF_G00213600 [Aldrovandia affinis]|uniref:Uncharacterized protein n=1 Tax=Aldrovandia affinis TaxID=143900 RepID=A0AAD7RGZ9_9TELE|nr:hypothetical protein AAFF_G00213600 [Aldrovandia affinis]
MKLKEIRQGSRPPLGQPKTPGGSVWRTERPSLSRGRKTVCLALSHATLQIARSRTNARFPATAYGPVAAAVAAARGSGFPEYGFYPAPSDHRGAPCSFADYGSSLGPPAPEMLQSEHAPATCTSPLQHLRSPDQYKSPGTNPPRPGGFHGTNSPGPVADLYGTASQDSGVGNYISAASPQPGPGFGHSIAGPLIATAFTNGYH